MEDEDFDLIEDNQVYVKTRPGSIIEIPILGHIQQPEAYNDLVYYLRDAKPEDEVHLMINSDGGRVDGALHIVNAIQNCKAGVIKAEITGPCSSAATFIFFAAKSWVVAPVASMLLHSTSYGTEGMTPHINSMAKHEVAHLEHMCNLFYKHFLTQKEIRGLLRGDQLYFLSDEITKRLERRVKRLNKEAKQ